MSLTAINISGSFTVNNFPITGSTSGTAGTSGSSGTSGTSGSSGTAGTSGSSGSSGTSGSNGSSGTSGINGTSGSSGTSGSNGSSGTSGTSGSSGSSGTTGSSGTSGSSGSSGTSGVAGSSGTSGTSGSNGSDGSSGTSGQAGSSGTSGTSFESPYTGDIIVTGSIDITGQFLVNGVPVTGSGGGDRNGLITTGSVSSTQQITGSLILGNTVISGSLVGNAINNGLINFTSEARLSGSVQLNITSSSPVTQSNLLLNGGPAPIATQTGSIVISGSNNIIFNPFRNNTIPTPFPGSYGYLGGNNIVGTIPTLNTGSLLSPVMLNNQLNGALTINLITASVNSQFNNNVIYNSVTINSQSGSVNYAQNINNGIVAINQNTNLLTGSIISARQSSIINNNFAGNITLNNISSSIAASNNITFGTNNFVTNSFFQTGSNNFVELRQNIIGGFNNHVQYGGNPATNAARLFSTNILGGIGNVVNLNATGSNTDMFSSIIYGNNLSVNPQQSMSGLAAFGQWNKIITGNTIFVVGNGSGAGDRRNAIEVDGSGNTIISGSARISGSLFLNGSPVGDGNRNGLITTGSHNFTQFMSGALKISNTSNAGHDYLLQAEAWSSNMNALSVTGVTNITGSLILNGTTITSIDRNGLITTGSAFATQNITGSLIVSSSNVTIIAGPGNPTNTLDIQSGSMRMSDASGSIRIATANNQPQLFFSPSRNVGFFLGQSNMDQVNTQFGITDDSTDNYTMGGNFNNFRTGSNNLMLGVQNISLRSGSHNIILARDTAYNTGSNNLILGRGPSGVNECESYFNLQLPNDGNPIMFKSGSAAPLTLNSNTVITGSLSVSSLSNASGSFVVTTDSTGILTKSPYSAVTSNLFSVGDFYSTQTQTLAAGVSGSATYNNTGTSFGVTLASSSQLTIANAGVYSITFSAQLKGDGGQDTVYMWLKKNGTNVNNTSTKLVVKNNEESVMTVEYIVEAAANDYYEIAWQNANGDGDLIYEAPSGNIPAVPSIITSVKQVR
jgi:hypothetical protein